MRDIVPYDMWSHKYKHFCTFESIKYSLLYEWAGNIEWKIVCDYLDIHIVVFREKDCSLYWFNFDTKDIQHDPNKRLIFILNKHDSHFQPILYKKCSQIQYLFHFTPTIIHFLKSRLTSKGQNDQSTQ